jgi:hypothetical protein
MFYAAPSTHSPPRGEATSALSADLKHCPLPEEGVIRSDSHHFCAANASVSRITRPERERTRTHFRYGLKVWVAGRIKDGSGVSAEVWTP